MTPEGWQKRRVREFCERVKRINVEGRDLEPLSITKDRGVILQSEKYHKRIATDSRKYVIAADGDFAFDPMSLYYGAIGRVGGIGEGLVSPDYVVFRADPTVDPVFLHAILRFPEMHKVYESWSETGNTFGKRRRLYWSVFEDIELVLPPRSEQTKIAAILSSVDGAIEATRAVIDQLGVVKRAMMAELLTRGLPGQHPRFKQTEIGDVPEDWEVVPLERLCAEVVDCPHTTPIYVNAGFPVIRTADVIPGRILIHQAKQVSEETLCDRVKRLLPRPGDIFYSREGERFGIAGPVPHGVRTCVGQRMMHLRADSATDPSFLCWLMNAPVVYGQAVAEVGGSTSPHVNVGSVKRFLVPRPAKAEQTAIGIVLDGVERRVEREEAVLNSLTAVKSALMSVLLTGEVRAKPDEERAA
jgi:type I restriction enzyme S subunit